MTKAAPILKWAGGKGRLLSQLTTLVPSERGRYFEPFLGGGAMFFALAPERACISDVNQELVRTYAAVRDDVDGVLEHLRQLATRIDVDSYYAIRDRYNELGLSDAEHAATFIYLNRTCFNGLHRVNRNGDFNVPCGRYKNPRIVDEDGLRAASAALARAELRCGDFTFGVEDARAGDFVYLDPPYVPTSETANFTAYASGGFGLDEHRRLRDLCLELRDRGCLVMLSNSDVPAIRELYAEFRIDTVRATRSVAGKASSRGAVGELVIRNFGGEAQPADAPSASSTPSPPLTDYELFLGGKRPEVERHGFHVDGLGPHLFPFQREIVEWALERGRAAIFAECGLGKTAMQLEWARHVSRRGPAIILAPLAVAQQTVREGQRFGVEVRYARDGEDAGDAPIVITNYERLDRFDLGKYSGVVLDESSILKSFMGATKRALVDACRSVPYRLACTATPAPNDHLELGNHAEFLGVMQSHEMIARWFINDTSTFGTYRLKGHAVEAFWDWVASWAMCVGAPSDLGYDDGDFALPELQLVPHRLEVDLLEDRGDTLFRIPELSATAIHKEKRRTLDERCANVVDLVRAEPDEAWLIWCDTNSEADLLASLLPEAVEVRGSDSLEWKENAALWFCGLHEEPCRCQSTKNDASTTDGTTRRTEGSGSHAVESSATDTTPNDGPSTPPTRRSAKLTRQRSANGSETTQGSAPHSDFASTGSHPSSTLASSPPRAACAASADDPSRPTSSAPARSDAGSTSTTAIEQGACEDSSARPATSESGSSQTTRSASSAPLCTCGRLTNARPKWLISKSSIFGLGINYQHCARVAFVGATFSYEAFYQAIRRCWRFGQKRPVDVHVTMASTEASVWSILTAKRDGHDEMRAQMSAAMRRARARDAHVQRYAPSTPMRVPTWLRSEAA